MSEKPYQLDYAAQRLFEQLDGLEESEVSHYFDEHKKLNDWRKCLVEFACILAQTLNSYRLSDTNIRNKDDMKPLMEKLNLMADIPSIDREKKVIIRHRGLSTSVNSKEYECLMEYDYVISVGDCMVDRQFLTHLVNSKIIGPPELILQLDKAFRFFSFSGIYIIELSLNEWTLRDKKLTDATLLLWARYFMEVAAKTNRIIYNETGQPDPNLTIIARLNGLKIESFQRFVKNLYKSMLKDDPNKIFADGQSTYDALFLIDGLKTKLVRPPIEINNNNYIHMWRQCFNKSGRFNRTQFYLFKNQFEKWENAFYLLWLDLKSVALKEDQTSILSCLLRFIKDSKYMDGYVDYIMKDFFYYPLQLHYADINSMILVNLLMFKNFGNENYDFGHTPEDFIVINEGKNAQLVERLSLKISNEWEDRVHEKLKTIRKQLELSLQSPDDWVEMMPATYLLDLLREVFIFLTLVGGRKIHKILRDVVEEYGDPESKIYHFKKSAEHTTQILQFLKVAIRCLFVLREENDVEVFNMIKIFEQKFFALKGLPHKEVSVHKELVKKIISIVDEEIHTISLSNIKLKSSINPPVTDDASYI